MSQSTDQNIVWNSLGRTSDVSVSAGAIYDPLVTGFRIQTTNDFTNININGATPVLSVIYPISSGISNYSTGVGINNTGLLVSGSSNKRGFYIQNLSPNNLYILFGGNAQPGINNFNVLLFGSGSNGSTWTDNYIRFSGNVYGSGSPLSYIAWNF